MFKLKRIVTIPASKYVCALSSSSYVLKPLKERSLIKLVGEETHNYLQGLITNDIQHISNKNTSQYAMFLNSKGRVLYDTIIYKTDENTYFLECDRSIADMLQKHLKLYKLKRKIDVLTTDYKIHSLFNKNMYDLVLKNRGALNCSEVVVDPVFTNTEKMNFSIFRDPRISQLGYRVLSNKTDILEGLSQFVNIDSDNDDSFSYRKYRYMLGVGEGVVDQPCGNCFPLESNCDYLHGVSFHKGCYIGQELTARTYHTGVTRKRLVPVYFNEPLVEMPIDDSVTHEKLKLGKLRGVLDNVGLALLRIDLVYSIQNLTIGGVEVRVGKPFWWPIEAPKDKLNVKRPVIES